MKLSPLLPFDEAAELASIRALLPTTLSSAQIQQISGEILRRSVFSSRTDSAWYLQQIADVSKSVLNPTTETGEDGQPVTKGMNPADAVLHLKQSLLQEGYQPKEGERGTIKDLGSRQRRDLVVKTNVQVMQGAGHYAEGTNPDVLDAFPCWELVRFEARKQERAWKTRWMEAGRHVGDFEALRALDQFGRMVARKDSRIWAALGDPELFPDALGNPYPPFAFNSGMWIQDVSREDAQKLGIDVRDVKPESLDFSPISETAITDERLQNQIVVGLGDGYRFEDGVLKNRWDSPSPILNRLRLLVGSFIGNAYNPNQPRDNLGKWVDENGGGLSEPDNIKRGMKAVRRALVQKRDVPNAMYRKGLGAIHFLYGTPGATRNEFKGGFGISHIVAKHGRADALALPVVIARGKIHTHTSPEKRLITHGDYEAALVKENSRSAWVLTGFKSRRQVTI